MFLGGLGDNRRSWRKPTLGEQAQKFHTGSKPSMGLSLKLGGCKITHYVLPVMFFYMDICSRLLDIMGLEVGLFLNTCESVCENEIMKILYFAMTGTHRHSGEVSQCKRNQMAISIHFTNGVNALHAVMTSLGTTLTRLPSPSSPSPFLLTQIGRK